MGRNELVVFSVGLLLLACLVSGQQPLTLCVSSNLRQECTLLQQRQNRIDCRYGRDTLDCIKKVQQQEADMVVADAQEVYTAGKYFNLVPIAYFEEKRKPYKYRATALVKRGQKISRLSDLKGLKSCHTGVGRTAGWAVPLSVLVRDSSLPVDCRGDLHTMAAIFKKSCAPGEWSPDKDLDKYLKKEHSSLCKLCSSKDCSAEDEFAGYQGAIKCLADDKGDIAFTTIEAIFQYFRGSSRAAEYKLVCKNGTLVDVAENTACYWARRPTAAFLASSTVAKDRKNLFYNNVRDLYNLFTTPYPDWLIRLLPALKDNVTNIIQTNDSNNQWKSYLGDYLPTIQMAYRGCANRSVKLCAPNTRASARCEDLSRMAEGRHLNPHLSCESGDSKLDCVDKVRRGQADIVVMDSNQGVYLAGRYNGMKPVLKEVYNDSTGSYYAVALIKADSKIKNFKDLKGARSCHTGLNQTTGWIVPIGVLMEKKMMSDNCDRALAMAEFFNGSCAPGANDSRYNPHHAGAASLCRLCVGDDMGRSRCAPIAQERYFGHLGVLRCLQEGHGDVAFTKHSTIFQYADGKSQVPWARDLRSSNFRLLCTDGRIVPVSDFKSCHLAQIPGRMITMGKKIDQGDRVNIARMLTNAAKMFGQNSTLFRMFGTYHGSADVLFKDNTNGFKLVSIKGDYKEVFTSRFLHIMERSDPHKCINSATDSIPSFLALLASLIISYLLFN